jgi:hypothetical protein
MVGFAILSELYLSHRWLYGSFVTWSDAVNRSEAVSLDALLAIPEDVQCAPTTGRSVLFEEGPVRFDILQAARVGGDVINELWRPRRTIDRLRRKMVSYTAATAVVGTACWAYGHILIEIF